jgi:hypothetical protein
MNVWLPDDIEEAVLSCIDDATERLEVIFCSDPDVRQPLIVYAGPSARLPGRRGAVADADGEQDLRSGVGR